MIAGVALLLPLLPLPGRHLVASTLEGGPEGSSSSERDCASTDASSSRALSIVVRAGKTSIATSTPSRIDRDHRKLLIATGMRRRYGSYLGKLIPAREDIPNRIRRVYVKHQTRVRLKRRVSPKRAAGLDRFAGYRRVCLSDGEGARLIPQCRVPIMLIDIGFSEK